MRSHRPTIRRRGFTLVELLVTMTLIALLASTIVVAFARSGENARIAGTRTLIKQLDSALQERLAAFQRQNLRSEALAFQSTQGSLAPLGPDTMDAFYRVIRFRGAFPQCADDLMGFNETNNNGNVDDSPLWRVIRRNHGAPAPTVFDDPPRQTLAWPCGSSELLYLFLTEGETFGAAPLDVGAINNSYIGDTDNDGFLEFLDGWGHPLQFYNFPTGLLRPEGNRSFDDTNGNPISVTRYSQARVLNTSLPQTTLPLQWINHFEDMLNTDPFDPLGEIGLVVYANPAGRQNFERFYHALDTYWTPLIVSAGPDEAFGLENATAADLTRLCVVVTNPSEQEGLYDNLTNQQRGL